MLEATTLVALAYFGALMPFTRNLPIDVQEFDSRTHAPYRYAVPRFRAERPGLSLLDMKFARIPGPHNEHHHLERWLAGCSDVYLRDEYMFSLTPIFVH